MSPGPLTTAHRGGFGFAPRSSGFGYARSDFTPHNRALHTAATGGRGFAGQRNRFAVSTDAETGAHSIALDDNEVATVTINTDGTATILIENKPVEDGNGGNGDARPAPSVGEPVEERRSLRQRLSGSAARVSKMSWERNPGDGSITFYPEEGEALDVNGDALMANVVAVPTPPPPG